MNESPTTSLQSAEDSLREAVASARKRRSVVTLAMVAFCLILAAYLGFAYYQIADVDADTVVALAETQVEPYLNQPAAQWADQLKERAPAVIDQAAEAALASPEAFSTQVVAYVEKRVQSDMPDLEKQFQEVMDRLIDKADETIRAEYPDGKIPDGEAEEFLTRVAEQFGSSLSGQIDKIYDHYAQLSGQMIDQLDELAKNEGLTETQRLHRQLLESFLAMLQRVQARQPA